MKKLNCAKTLIVAVIISMTAIFFLPQILLAKKAKEVKIVVSGSLYPEYGELLGLNMYFSALQGLSIRNPDLKKSVKIKVVDKGILCGSQDECLTMVSSGTAQMTYSSPHFLEQLMPEWKLGEFPGLFDNWSHFLRSMDTQVWKDLQERMAKEKGVTILKWAYDAGSWYFFSSKGPIKSLSDIKGQNVRIAGGDPGNHKGFLYQPLLSTSGGSATLASDEAESKGLVFPSLTAKAKEELGTIGLDVMAHITNPMDMPADNANIYLKAAKVIDRYDIADIILFSFGDPVNNADARFVNAAKKLKTSVVACYFGGGELELSSTPVMGQAGMAVFPTPERAVHGIVAAVQRSMYFKHRNMDREV